MKKTKREVLEEYFWDEDFCYSEKATAEYKKDFDYRINEALTQLNSLFDEGEIMNSLINTKIRILYGYKKNKLDRTQIISLGEKSRRIIAKTIKEYHDKL